MTFLLLAVLTLVGSWLFVKAFPSKNLQMRPAEPKDPTEPKDPADIAMLGLAKQIELDMYGNPTPNNPNDSYYANFGKTEKPKKKKSKSKKKDLGLFDEAESMPTKIKAPKKKKKKRSKR